jgi:fumarate hydratase class I
MIMLRKEIELQQVTNACKTYGGFYLGSGGPAAILAQDNILKEDRGFRGIRNGSGS